MANGSIDTRDPAHVISLLLERIKYERNGKTIIELYGDFLKALDCAPVAQYAPQDVFQPLLACSEIEDKVKFDLAGVMFSRLCISSKLHNLIGASLLSHAKHSYQDSDIGILDVLQFVTHVPSLTINTWRFMNMDIKDILLSCWLPWFIKLKTLEKNSISWYFENYEGLPSVLTRNSKLDIWLLQLESLDVESISKYPLLLNKVARRVVKNREYFPELLYNNIYGLIFSQGMELPPVSTTPLHISLQIMMEVIDQPDLNFLEYPRLTVLLLIALKELYQYPVHKIHGALSDLKTTQSLPAMLNMLCYILIKFMLSTSNAALSLHKISEGQLLEFQKKKVPPEFFSKHMASYQLPEWFRREVLPPLPPITQSMFVLNKKDSPILFDHSSSDILSDIMQSLLLTLQLEIKILAQYKSINLNPINLEIIPNKLCHFLVMEHYMSLFTVTCTSALLLSEALECIGGYLNILNTKILNVNSKLIKIHSHSIIENFVELHRNAALFHSMKFMSKLSMSDLVFQKICVRLLEHLFFHGDPEKNETVKQICISSALNMEVLKEFVTIWDDGSETYGKFFECVIESRREHNGSVSISLRELTKYLPENERDKLCAAFNESASVCIDRVSDLSGSLLGASTPTKYNNMEATQQKTPSRSQNPGPFDMASTLKYNPQMSSAFVPVNKMLINNYSAISSVNPSALDMSSSPRTPNPYEGYYQTPITQNMAHQPSQSATCPSNNSNSSSYCGQYAMNSVLSSNGFSTQTQGLAVKENKFMSSPRTPGPSIFNSTWRESPNDSSKGSISMVNTKIVSTGKNYILGGHNKVKNNSRAQSIHIDDYEQAMQNMLT